MGHTDMSDAELGITGYVMFRKDIMGTSGDGVILYIQGSIQPYKTQLETNIMRRTLLV